MKQNKFLKNKKYIAVNLILFAVLYVLVSFNKEYSRPVFGNLPILGILTGSFSNFIAAYILSLFVVAPILSKRIRIVNARKIFYAVALSVFIILTIEEFSSFFGASKTFDIYDIIASGLGSLFAIVTFEILFVRISQK